MALPPSMDAKFRRVVDILKAKAEISPKELQCLHPSKLNDVLRLDLEEAATDKTPRLHETGRPILEDHPWIWPVIDRSLCQHLGDPRLCLGTSPAPFHEDLLLTNASLSFVSLFSLWYWPLWPANQWPRHMFVALASCAQVQTCRRFHLSRAPAWYEQQLSSK